MCEHTFMHFYASVHMRRLLQRISEVQVIDSIGFYSDVFLDFNAN